MEFLEKTEFLFWSKSYAPLVCQMLNAEKCGWMDLLLLMLIAVRPPSYLLHSSNAHSAGSWVNLVISGRKLLWTLSSVLLFIHSSYAFPVVHTFSRKLNILQEFHNDCSPSVTIKPLLKFRCLKKQRNKKNPALIRQEGIRFTNNSLIFYGQWWFSK